MSSEEAPSPWRQTRFRWFALGNVTNNIGVGWMTGIPSMNLAALIGALSVSERKTFKPVIVVSWIVGGATVALFGASIPTLTIIVGALVALTLFDGAESSAHSMLVVHYVPEEILGRADGTLRLVHGIPAVLGPICVAALMPYIGAQAMFVVLAGLMLLVSVGISVFRYRMNTQSMEAGVCRRQRETER